MKKVLLLLSFLLVFFTPYAQDVRAKRVISDQVFNPPLIDTILVPWRIGQLVTRPQDTIVYIGIKITAGGKHWDKLANRIGAIPGGSSSADSTIFATLYRLDTAKINLRTLIGSKLAITDTANKYITSFYRKPGTDSVFYTKGSSHTFAFKDSIGSGGGGLSGSGVDLRVALWNGTNSLTSHQRYTWANSNDYPSLIIGAGSGVTYGASVQLRSAVGDYGSISSDGNQFAIYGLPGTKTVNIYSHSGGNLLLTLQKATGGGNAIFRKTTISVDTAAGGPSIGSIHGEYAAGDSTSSGTDVGRHMFRGIGKTYANVGSFNTFYSTVVAGNNNAGIIQDHIVSWQSDAEKTGASTLNIIYEGAMLATQIKGGTVGKKYGFKYWDANMYPGTRLGSQMAFKTDKLKAASGLNFHFLADSSHYAQLDGNVLIGDSVVAASARKTLHLFNGTAPTGNISGSVLYSESGEFKIRNSSGAINKLSGNAEFSGYIKTGDPGSGAANWKVGTAVTTSGLILKTTEYVEIYIEGKGVVRLAVVDPPQP